MPFVAPTEPAHYAPHSAVDPIQTILAEMLAVPHHLAIVDEHTMFNECYILTIVQRTRIHTISVCSGGECNMHCII